MGLKNMRESSILFVFLLCTLAVGVILGSIWLVRSELSGGDISTYISTFLESSKGEMDKWGIFKSTLIENGVYLIIIFISGFFRIGIAFTLAALVRKGFVLGFTIASFIKIYGIKGLMPVLSMLPVNLLIIPAVITFSVISVNLSVKKEKNEKKNIIFYIFFALIVMSIFCAAAFFEGYITTIFMKFTATKLLG